MIDAEEIARLQKWIADGGDPDEVKRRSEAVNALLGEAKTEKTADPPPEPKKHYGLIDPSRPGYRRAQREEAAGRVAVAMRERARGSPFEAMQPIEEPTRKKSKLEIADALARLAIPHERKE